MSKEPLDRASILKLNTSVSAKHKALTLKICTKRDKVFEGFWFKV